MAEDIRFTDIDNIRIATPCRASWNTTEKVGGDRVRHCGKCGLNVYNLSEMSRREAFSLVEQHEGHICVRFYRRIDGTVLTQDCPVGIHGFFVVTACRPLRRFGGWLLTLPTYWSPFLPVYGSPRFSPPLEEITDVERDEWEEKQAILKERVEREMEKDRETTEQ